MPKLTLSDPVSLTNETSFLATIAANNAAIETAMENTLSRDGTSPNSMSADLDMNSNDIINVGLIQADDISIGGDDLAGYLATIEAAVTAAELAETHAETAETNAETAEAGAEAALAEVEDLIATLPTIADYPTKAAVQAATIDSSIQFLRTAGYTTAGDGGDGLYKKSVSEPTHVGKIQSADGAWWEYIPEAGRRWNALALGIIVGDNSTNQASNTTILQDIDGNMSSGDTLVLPAGTIRVSGLISLPNFRSMEGVSMLSTIIKSDASAGGNVIAITGRSVNLKNFTIDSTAARRAGTTAYGILISDGDVVHASMSRINLTNITVQNQPGVGIRTIASLTSSTWKHVECYDNLSHGIFIDDGTGESYSNLLTGNTGLLTIDHFRANGNGGHAIALGYPGQTNVPARVNLSQYDVYNNCWDATKAITIKSSVTLGANPIATTNLSNVITVTQTGGHPAIQGNFVTIAGASAFNGLTTGQLNKTHQVTSWLSDTTFTITLTAGTANATSSGGGASVTAVHKAHAQMFLSGTSVKVFNCGQGTTGYASATTELGNPKTALQLPSGGIYWYQSDGSGDEQARYIDTCYAWSKDWAGTPSGNQATSLCQKDFSVWPRMINTTVTQDYSFYNPANSDMYIKMASQSSYTTVGFNRDTQLILDLNGTRYVGINNAGGIWATDVTHALANGTISSGTLSLFHGFYRVIGQGNVADDLDNIFTLGATPPAAFVVRLVNNNAYTITVKHGTGNIKTKSASDVSMTTNTARMFISDGTYMYEM